MSGIRKGVVNMTGIANKPRTVYITNMARNHVYASAAKYGALRPITSGNYPIYKTTRLQDEIIQSLAYSEPEDYLAISGSSVVAAICLAVWLEMHGTCNVLLFRPGEDTYLLRVLSREDIRLEIERTSDQLKGRPTTSRLVRHDTEVA